MIVISRTGRHRALAGTPGTMRLLAGSPARRRAVWARAHLAVIASMLSTATLLAVVWLLM